MNTLLYYNQICGKIGYGPYLRSLNIYNVCGTEWGHEESYSGHCKDRIFERDLKLPTHRQTQITAHTHPINKSMRYRDLGKSKCAGSAHI